MAFKAGAITGEAVLNTKQWNSAVKGLSSGTKIAMAAVTAAISAAAVKSIQQANEFQKSMSNVATIIDTAAISTQEFAFQLLQLDPALGSTTELTDALYQSISAGAVTAEAAMSTVVDAAKFSKAALTDTATAVDVLTTAVNAYGAENVSTTQASDIFFKTIQLGKVTGDELASTIGTSIPLFASAGIGLEELGSGLATLTKQGVNSANATTQLNAIVTSFLKPSEEMKNRLMEIGFESGSAFLEAEGLAGALDLLQTSTQGDAAAMAALLPNVRALRGAMALTGQGAAIFEDTLIQMGDAAGVTQEAFDKQEKTFETYLNSANKIQIVLGNIGKFFLDEIAVGATAANESLLGFILSAQFMEIVADIVGVLSATFNTIKVILSELFDVIRPAITEIWEALTSALGDLAGETDLVAVGSKVLSGIINVVTAALSVQAKIVKSVIDLYGDWILAIKETGGVVGEFFKFLKGDVEFEAVKQQARNAGEAFKNIGVNFIDNVGEVFETARDEIVTFGQDVSDVSSTIEGTITTSFQRSSDSVRANWGEMLTGQEDMVDQILANQLMLSEGVEETNEDIEDSTETALERMIEKYGEYFDAVMSGFSALHSGLGEITTLNFENQRRELDLQIQAEDAARMQQLEQGVITQEEFDELQAQADEQNRQKRNDIAEKAFAAEKKNQIAGIWIDAAGAIAGWWRTASRLGLFGIGFGAAMTAATLALAGKQTQLVAKQKFVPSLQEGGMASGLTQINERGGEIIDLPDGSIVIPNDISREIAANANTGTVINVSFAGAKISDDMSLRKIADEVVRRMGREMRVAG